jgi:hypothetical protein
LGKIAKLAKKLDHMNTTLSKLKSKIEAEEDEDRITAIEEAQQETLFQRVQITKQIKSLQSATGGILTYLDSNEEEHEIDMASLNPSDKESLIGLMLDDAAEELSSRFSEDKLLEFIQLPENGDKREVLIGFLKEISVQRDKLTVSFKNGKRFETTLIPNRGRKIQNKFTVVAYFDEKEEGSFVIDCIDKTTEWNPYPLDACTARILTHPNGRKLTHPQRW